MQCRSTAEHGWGIPGEARCHGGRAERDDRARHSDAQQKALYQSKRIWQLTPGFEPGFGDSESPVLTTTLCERALGAETATQPIIVQFAITAYNHVIRDARHQHWVVINVTMFWLMEFEQKPRLQAALWTQPRFEFRLIRPDSVTRHRRATWCGIPVLCLPFDCRNNTGSERAAPVSRSVCCLLRRALCRSVSRPVSSTAKQASC